MPFPSRRSVWLSAFLALLLAACVHTPRPPAMPEQAGDVGAVLRAQAQAHGVCAAVLAVVSKGRTAIHSADGGCARQPDTPGPDSVFQAASLSKPVFAYAVLQLVRSGRLALDAPVLRYLPQGVTHAFDPFAVPAPGRSAPVTDERLARVTVRMLLNHSAGLPNWARGPLRFEAEPGQAWRYSGEGYVLLQQVVQAVTGQPLQDFMQTQVFGPLGMRRSSYVWQERLAPALVRGTRANGRPWPFRPLTQAVAAATLYTTAADAARLLNGLLAEPALWAMIQEGAVPMGSGPGLAWGLGWGLETVDGRTTFWQWGNNPGYRALAMVQPQTGTGLVLLTNSDHGLALAEPVVKHVLPGSHPVLALPMLQPDWSQWLCRNLSLCL